LSTTLAGISLPGMAAIVIGLGVLVASVVVKVADGGHSAVSPHPSVARERVRAGTEAAVRRAAAGELQRLQVGPPVVIEVDYPRGVDADHGAVVPGAERIGHRTVRFAHDDAITAYRGFLAINRLASAVDH
jgi:D-amino peptidase